MKGKIDHLDERESRQIIGGNKLRTLTGVYVDGLDDKNIGRVREYNYAKGRFE